MNYDYHEAMKLSNQLCFPLYAASRNIVNLYTPHLKPLGLTYTQYLVLLVLWEKDGIPVGDICESLFLDNGTVSPLLKKLESIGLITKSRSPQDERIVTVSLTEKGRALQEKAADIPLKIGGCVKLEPQKAQQLYSLLYGLLGKTE